MDLKIGDIEVGVPQGSCFGPLLFLIYINDLSQAVQDSTVSMYADDTSLCYQSHDLTRLNEAINSDLKKLDTWLQASGVLARGGRGQGATAPLRVKYKGRQNGMFCPRVLLQT